MRTGQGLEAHGNSVSWCGVIGFSLGGTGHGFWSTSMLMHLSSVRWEMNRYRIFCYMWPERGRDQVGWTHVSIVFDSSSCWSVNRFGTACRTPSDRAMRRVWGALESLSEYLCVCERRIGCHLDMWAQERLVKISSRPRREAWRGLAWSMKSPTITQL